MGVFVEGHKGGIGGTPAGFFAGFKVADEECAATRAGPSWVRSSGGAFFNHDNEYPKEWGSGLGRFIICVAIRHHILEMSILDIIQVE